MDNIFWAYGQPLPNIGFFKYLDRLLLAKDNGWLVVLENLRKTQKR